MSFLIPFEKPLVKATIKYRPNRFIVVAEVDGKEVKCHCPVSGRIGGFTLDGQLCLLSGPYEGRGTTYTVEAIALEDETSPSFQWIGVNQTRCNKIVEECLKNGVFASVFPEATQDNVRREVKLADNRIDFLVADSTWIEVKMPVLKIHAVSDPAVPMKEFPPGNPSERLPRQMKALTDEITLGKRAAMLVCFQYKNTLATPLKKQVEENIFPDAALVKAKENGLEQWIAHYEVSPTGIIFNKIESY